MGMKRSKTISLYQLLTSFPDEDSARQYVEEMRWHGRGYALTAGKSMGNMLLPAKMERVTINAASAKRCTP